MIRDQQELENAALEYLKYRKRAKRKNTTITQIELQEYQKRFLEKFRYLVAARTNKYKKFPNYPDLVQDAHEGLLLALNSYNPKKGSFTWWADKYVSTRVVRSANAHSTIRVPIQKAKLTKPYKTSTFPVMPDLSPNGFDFCQTKELSDKIRSIISSNLSESHQKIVSMIFGLKGRSYSIKDTTKILSISKLECVRKLEEAKQIIKQSFTNLQGTDGPSPE